MANTIDLTVEVSDEFIRDIMTNAVETGAMRGWAEVRRIMRDKGLNVLSFQVADNEDLYDLQEEAGQTGVEPEKAAVDALFETVNKDIILNGLRVLLSNIAYVADDIRSMIYTAVIEDDADIDAIGCDCIVQAGLFGEIVYG